MLSAPFCASFGSPCDIVSTSGKPVKTDVRKETRADAVAFANAIKISCPNSPQLLTLASVTVKRNATIKPCIKDRNAHIPQARQKLDLFLRDMAATYIDR